LLFVLNNVYALGAYTPPKMRSLMKQLSPTISQTLDKEVPDM